MRAAYLSQGTPPAQIQAVSMMLYIAALIAEGSDLDRIGVENEGGFVEGETC
jgi:hypothetical protein